MRPIAVFLTCFFSGMMLAGCQAQGLKPIELLEPTAERGGNLMQAFQQRESLRVYSDQELALQDLSDLVWAANGQNRAETGKLTAPTAQNKQEITLYVFTPQGAYLYDAKAHVLQPVAEGDFRADLAGPQDFAVKAPVNLVIVGDFSVFPPERNWAMTDAGYVSQNIYLFCAGNNMATVARGTMDKAKIKEVLKLRPEQEPILNHPVGYKK